MRLLLALLIPAIFSAASWADPAKWEKDIAAFEKADAASPPQPGGILFTGSSSIRLWKTLSADFPKHRVVNRGFGGSQMEDSVAFAERVVFPHAPRMIFIYAGGNDINAGKSPQRVLEDYKAFVAKVRAKLPDVVIAYISVAGNPARWAQVEKVRETNRLIADYTSSDPKLKFVNVFDAMMGPDGTPKPDIFVEDRLHMNEKGYAIWREIIGAHLPAP